MSHIERAALLGSFLLLTGCGPAPLEGPVPVAQVVQLTTGSSGMEVTDFAYNYIYESGTGGGAVYRAAACGAYRVELTATFSQFPARILAQTCLGPSGALTGCEALHEVVCDLGTLACKALPFDEATTDPSAITLIPTAGGYTVRVVSAVRFQGCNAYVPTNVKLRIQGLNSVQSSPWTEAACGHPAYPAYSHYQCR